MPGRTSSKQQTDIGRPKTDYAAEEAAALYENQLSSVKDQVRAIMNRYAYGTKKDITDISHLNGNLQSCIRLLRSGQQLGIVGESMLEQAAIEMLAEALARQAAQNGSSEA